MMELKLNEFVDHLLPYSYINIIYTSTYIHIYIHFFSFRLVNVYMRQETLYELFQTTEYHEFEAIMTHQHRQLGLCTKKLKQKKKKKLDLLIHQRERTQPAQEVPQRTQRKARRFCPTPRSLDHQQLSQDIAEGCSRIRLKELYYDPDDDEESTPPKLYKRTGVVPPSGRDKAL